MFRLIFKAVLTIRAISQVFISMDVLRFIEGKRKMTTPKINEIEKRARELWHIDRARNGDPSFDIEPEIEELKESGFWNVAVSELMMSISRKTEEFKEYAEQTENLQIKELTEFLDINEILKSGCYVSGTSGHGKSDLLMYISDLLMQNNVIVIVIDSSQDWSLRSSIPKVQTITNTWIDQILEDSSIMDISFLTIQERQTYVENFCRILYEQQAKTPKHLRKQFFIVFEESHVYLTEAMLRSKKFQNITRLLTEGRNYNVRFACITQFASLISKVAMKFMRMRFFGYADEPNDLKFISGFLGSKYVKLLRNLEHGSFIAYFSGKLCVVNIEPYRNSNTTKTWITIPESTLEPIQLPKQTTDTAKAITSLIIAGLWFIAIILGIPK